MIMDLHKLLQDRGINTSITNELIEGIVSRKFDNTLEETADIIAKNYNKVTLYSVEVITCQRIVSTEPLFTEIGDSIVVRMKGESK